MPWRRGIRQAEKGRASTHVRQLQLWQNAVRRPNYAFKIAVHRGVERLPSYFRAAGFRIIEQRCTPWFGFASTDSTLIPIGSHPNRASSR